MFLLSSGLDAFIGRVVLTNLAERSIDVQYDMFHQDMAELLISQLRPSMQKATDERNILFPVSFPGKRGAGVLGTLSAKGVQMGILTNSLASNDLSAVHFSSASIFKMVARSAPGFWVKMAATRRAV